MKNEKNAQQWLDEGYPLNDVCKSLFDKVNEKKKRSEINVLIINGEAVGDDKELVGILKLEGFTNLEHLNCSSHGLEELDVSDCPNLLVIDCKKNNLKSVNFANCSKLGILDISYNRYLEELDLSNNLNLKLVNINKCSLLKFNKVKKVEKLEFNPEKHCFELPAYLSQIFNAEDKIRNILVIGWTGNGKSNLANCLTSSNQFISESSSMSITETYKKSDLFEYNKKRYCVIDNIGFGDTRNFFKEDLLYRIGQGIYAAKEGINQILFVVKDRFTENHIEAFKRFESLINQTNIASFTTIVRTNFSNYRGNEEVENDRNQLISQSDRIKDLIESCNDIIYIDSPALPIVNSNDDELEREIKNLEMEIALGKRKDSREIVMNYLDTNCNQIYKLEGWDCVYNAVSSHFKRIEKLESQLNTVGSNGTRIREIINNEKDQVTTVLENSMNIINTTTGTVSMVTGIIQTAAAFIL